MSSALERRKELLNLMRLLTLEKGYFTITDVSDSMQIPRSTAQDWFNRLIDERCILQKKEKRGRHPAEYVVTSAMLSSACRRIFTTVDDDMVAIYHECMSGGCAAYCACQHNLARGSIAHARQEGTLLIEHARLGEYDADVGFYPSAAVGIVGVRREGDHIIQRIRCVGGPAYSLTEMMMMAKGVEDVVLRREGPMVEGEVFTRALEHAIIGVDDTDTKSGGATFALALGLLQYIGKMNGVIPIGHNVVMLNPYHVRRTGGNACSFIEFAIEPGRFSQLPGIISRFMAEESLSPEWGVAIKRGFLIPDELREFGKDARSRDITVQEARDLAERCGVTLIGRAGIIGALAAIAFSGLSSEVMLNPLGEDRA